ncbi:MAG: hypothetical protein VX899_04230 [Myxococcota bacterium]|nr:hypothetical protein [Myxococcota bacterium]
MAPDVLLALVSAGAELWVEDQRLRFRAPAGTLDDELRAAAGRVRGSLIALVKAGAVLPVDRAAWSDDDIADFEERAGMLTFDAGMAPSDAEREAERLVRLAHTRAFVGRAALIHHDFDESVDTPAGGAVAPFPGRGAARTG